LWVCAFLVPSCFHLLDERFQTLWSRTIAEPMNFSEWFRGISIRLLNVGWLGLFLPNGGDSESLSTQDWLGIHICVSSAGSPEWRRKFELVFVKNSQHRSSKGRQFCRKGVRHSWERRKQLLQRKKTVQ
jgi:hypothetical protein